MTIKEFINENKNYIELQKCSMLLPKAESVMYSYLIDLESWDEIKHLPSDPSFFWANKEGFMDKYLLGWSIKEMTHAINNLVEAGYIETKVVNVNMRNRTYIRLNFNAYVRLNRLWEDYKMVIPNLTKEQLASVRNACSQVNNIDTLELLIGEVIQTEVSNLRNQPYEPSLSSGTNVPTPSSEPSVQGVNKSLNKQIDDNIEGTDVKQQIEGTNKESINMNSKSPKNIMMFIDSLSYTDKTKKELKNWYNEVAKGRVSVIQLKDKLDDTYRAVKNEDELCESIFNAYINSYMAFYPQKKFFKHNTNNTSNGTTYHSRTLEEIQKERDEVSVFMQTGETF